MNSIDLISRSAYQDSSRSNNHKMERSISYDVVPICGFLRRFQ